MTATLTEKGCAFTATAKWSGYSVDTVIAMFHLDGAWLATMQAPFTGPNAGTIKGRTATFKTGAFATTAAPHDFQVLVQLYYQGAHVAETWTNVRTASCGVAP